MKKARRNHSKKIYQTKNAHPMAEDIKQDIEYGSDSIRTLDWKEHIRRRPGMYIGKLGDGTHADDGIYVVLNEVIDYAID